MSSEWLATTIGTICLNVYSGGTPKSTDASYYGGSIPWLRTKEVNYEKIFHTEKHITDSGLKNSSAKTVPVNSIIVAMYGNGDTAGRVAINKIPLTTNQACCNLIINENKADYRFVYYYLMAHYKPLVDLKNGGAQQNLNGQLIKSFPIQLPKLCEQRTIATLLEWLDDRRTLLRETNKTLESIAQAMFKSWFVDFDPVRAKMEGRQPEGMDDETAVLFPDSFDETGLETKPLGWNSGTLSAIMDLHKGSVNPGISPNVAFRHFSLPAYDAGQLPIVELGQAIKSNKTRVPRNAALLSKLNPHIPRVWLPSLVEGHSVCSTEFLPFVPKNGATTAFIYSWLSSPNFTAKIRGLVTGTSNSHQRIKPDNILSTEAILPPAPVVERFDGIVSALFERIKANRMTGKTLADLRDNLLPRLISGQLRLPEAQEQVKNALS